MNDSNDFYSGQMYITDGVISFHGDEAFQMMASQTIEKMKSVSFKEGKESVISNLLNSVEKLASGL